SAVQPRVPMLRPSIHAGQPRVASVRLHKQGGHARTCRTRAFSLHLAPVAPQFRCYVPIAAGRQPVCLGAVVLLPPSMALRATFGSPAAFGMNGTPYMRRCSHWSWLRDLPSRPRLMPVSSASSSCVRKRLMSDAQPVLAFVGLLGTTKAGDDVSEPVHCRSLI